MADSLKQKVLILGCNAVSSPCIYSDMLRVMSHRSTCRYVGYALTTVWEGSEAGDQQVIGFDMGGTSTDVSRYAGTYEHVFESTTAGEQSDAPLRLEI